MPSSLGDDRARLNPYGPPERPPHARDDGPAGRPSRPPRGLPYRLRRAESGRATSGARRWPSTCGA